MWNDTEVPLAHLITFRCYGTWLHGDDRGAVDRFHNRYKAPFAPANQHRYKYNSGMLKGDAVILSARQRSSVERAIRETCAIRSWLLHAINVRTNHVHAVVTIGSKTPDRALNAFKANATRLMREDGNWQYEYSPWVDKGSKRDLWNERSIARAIDYVINGQGDELPDFD